MGTTKGGGFDISESEAIRFLAQPNPHGKPNSDVVVPWINGQDLVQRHRGLWIVDFGADLAEEGAAKYEAVFEFTRKMVKPERDSNARESYRRLWWQHVEARPAMRIALHNKPRFLCTTRVAKHRIFVWQSAPTLPDSATFAFARDDDYFLGILQSRAHELWSLKAGTRLETRPRYTPSTCFETFPFPEPTAAQREAIAAAAKELDRLRTNWLNPPEWTRVETLEFPGSADGPWARYVHDADSRGIGTVRYPRVVPKDEPCAKELKKRTLTNLYNARPAWLDLAHQKLDAAVFAAYGWPVTLSDDELLARLLELNLARSQG
jgi:type II restriction/modification system DNA methylase subunit YeeA